MTTINLDALIKTALEALKNNYQEKHPDEVLPEFSSLPPEEQEFTKSALGVIINSTGLIDKVEALNAEVARLNHQIDLVVAHYSNLINHLERFNRLAAVTPDQGT